MLSIIILFFSNFGFAQSDSLFFSHLLKSKQKSDIDKLETYVYGKKWEMIAVQKKKANFEIIDCDSNHHIICSFKLEKNQIILYSKNDTALYKAVNVKIFFDKKGFSNIDLNFNNEFIGQMYIRFKFINYNKDYLILELWEKKSKGKKNKKRFKKTGLLVYKISR